MREKYRVKIKRIGLPDKMERENRKDLEKSGKRED
jgi:hypothetical protein